MFSSLATNSNKNGKHAAVHTASSQCCWLLHLHHKGVRERQQERLQQVAMEIGFGIAYIAMSLQPHIICAVLAIYYSELLQARRGWCVLHIYACELPSNWNQLANQHLVATTWFALQMHGQEMNCHITRQCMYSCNKKVLFNKIINGYI